MVTIGTQQVAFCHLRVEQLLDLFQRGGLCMIVHQSTNAAPFTEEATHSLGGLVYVVEIKAGLLADSHRAMAIGALRDLTLGLIHVALFGIPYDGVEALVVRSYFLLRTVIFSPT